MIETDRIMEILDRFHVAKDSNIIGAMHQVAGEVAHEMKAKYADCDRCKENILKGFRQEIRTLLHVKGWDE